MDLRGELDLRTGFGHDQGETVETFTSLVALLSRRCRGVDCFLAGPVRLLPAKGMSVRVGAQTALNEFDDVRTRAKAPQEPWLLVEKGVERVAALLRGHRRNHQTPENGKRQSEDVEARLEDLSVTAESDWLPGEFVTA